MFILSNDDLNEVQEIVIDLVNEAGLPANTKERLFELLQIELKRRYKVKTTIEVEFEVVVEDGYVPEQSDYEDFEFTSTEVEELSAEIVDFEWDEVK